MNKSILSRLGCAVALTIVAAACSNSSVVEGPAVAVSAADIQAREAKLKAFNPWRASGSLAVQSQEQGKFNAAFAWETRAKGFDVKLFGPLGRQAVQVTQAEGSAKLVDNQGELTGVTAEELLFSVLGVPVPVGKMQIWAVGLPDDAQQIQRDSSGRLQSMLVNEGGVEWRVDYARYTAVEDLQLPAVILIESADTKIKMTFRKWSRMAPPASNGRLSIPGVGT